MPSVKICWQGQTPDEIFDENYFYEGRKLETLKNSTLRDSPMCGIKNDFEPKIC